MRTVPAVLRRLLGAPWCAVVDVAAEEDARPSGMPQA
jgi:hypothetical protein